MTDALKLREALEALVSSGGILSADTFAKCRAALAADASDQAPEPAAWFHRDNGVLELSRVQRVGWKPLYEAARPAPVDEAPAAYWKAQYECQLRIIESMKRREARADQLAAPDRAPSKPQELSSEAPEVSGQAHEVARAPSTDSATPLTDAAVLADPILRYHFGLNGGAGPVSAKGWSIINAARAIAAMKGEA